MRLLGKAATATTIRLDNIENAAQRLILGLDSLDSRLHRAFTALCIDSYLAYLDVERKQMLKDEKQAETHASLARLPALGIYGLFSIFTEQKPNWERAANSIFREKPYGDIRVAARKDAVKLINVSELARERGISIAEVITYLEQEGYKIFSWLEFEGRADDLRMAALEGKAVHLGIEKTALEGLQSITARSDTEAIAYHGT